jgi:hypothetical protein
MYRSLQFQKGGQFFICTHHETLSVVAMRVSNPDCAALTIELLRAASGSVLV